MVLKRDLKYSRGNSVGAQKRILGQSSVRKLESGHKIGQNGHRNKVGRTQGVLKLCSGYSNCLSEVADPRVNNARVRVTVHTN